MTKLNSDNLNFDNDDYIVNISDEKTKEELLIENFDNEFSNAELSLRQTELEALETKTKQKLEEAEIEASEIINGAKIEADEIINNAKNEAKNEAQSYIDELKNNCEKEIEETKKLKEEEIEKERIKIINEAYEEGHKEGVNKVREELEEKINLLDEFCSNQFNIKKNIIKSASADILDIITTISKKILLKETDAETIEKIIKETVNLLEEKENVNIILSTKYARLLYEIQENKLVEDDYEPNFEDFKQYKNFNIIYSPEYKDDTIIIENQKERFDASINAQLDVIIRDIYKAQEQNKIEFEIENDET